MNNNLNPISEDDRQNLDKQADNNTHQALCSAIIEGEHSGDPEPFDIKAIIKEAKQDPGIDD